MQTKHSGWQKILSTSSSHITTRSGSAKVNDEESSTSGNVEFEMMDFQDTNQVSDEIDENYEPCSATTTSSSFPERIAALFLQKAIDYAVHI